MDLFGLLRPMKMARSLADYVLLEVQRSTQRRMSVFAYLDSSLRNSRLYRKAIKHGPALLIDSIGHNVLWHKQFLAPQ